ncbi:hypothetical protein SAMN05880501_10774 [Ureibacillus xyleni]|uniref:Uncharacterized protein n=1 Tax=Ureibacillus xyleni TaxID=614648 RepID=A0A285SXX9_9BACL|nr:hypothetical protein [Ureibacillus xyleni]SOC12919.1 hypothetical protein SAMN05880501_10774 [Ureibacillus xyleni]
MTNYKVPVALTLHVAGNFPTVKYPSIGDTVGAFNGKAITRIFITSLNQKEFTIPYSLDVDEMQILNLTSVKGDVLDVDSCEMYINKDGQAIVDLSVILDIQADSEQQAYVLAGNYLNDNVISNFDYLDRTEDKVYSCIIQSSGFEVLGYSLVV